MKMRLSVRKSLALSCISMLLCISMLIGTTYAWFSESVTSHNNKIVSGTLTMTVSRWNGSGFENLSEKTDTSIFNYSKWEPGYTHGEILRLANTGTLSLKYRAVFKGLDLPVDTSELSLADVIEVYAFSNPQTGGNTIPHSRADLLSEPWKKLGTLREFLGKGNVVTGTLMPKNKTDSSCDIGIALSMVDDADTKYQGLDLGDFDISLFATQLTNEKDSFDENYDIEALSAWDENSVDTNWYNKNISVYEIYTPEQLAGVAKITNTLDGYPTYKKTFKLMADIDLGGKTWTPIGNSSKRFQGTFDGQGHYIKNLSSQTSQYGGLFGNIEGATITDLTVKNAKIKVTDKMAGIIAGYARKSDIRNVAIENSEVEGLQLIGGFIGLQNGNSNAVLISSCSISNTVVKGIFYTGGLAGLVNDIIIDNTVNESTNRLTKNDSQYISVNGYKYYASNKNLAWSQSYCKNAYVVYDGVTYHGVAD